MFKKTAVFLALTLVSTLSYAQACNCTVEPLTDGSFNVKCAGSSTVVLVIKQGITDPLPTTPITTKPTPPTAPQATPVPVADKEKERIRLLKEQYKNDPSVGIDDTGRMFFKPAEPAKQTPVPVTTPVPKPTPTTNPKGYYW